MRIRTTLAGLAAITALAAAGATASGDSGAPHPATAVAVAFAERDGHDKVAGKRQDLATATNDGSQSGKQTNASASTSGDRGSASASASLDNVDVFDGLVTASAVRVQASATGDGTSTSGSVAGLVIDGKPVDSPDGRTVYDLDGYGTLVALDSGPTGVLGLRARLTKPYKSFQPGDVVRVAYASAKAADAVTAPAPAAPARHKSAKHAHKSKHKAHGPRTPLQKVLAAVNNKRDRLWRKQLLRLPGYAFPVAGEHNFTDTFGAARADVPVHVGNDIFAAFGTPIVAVADGRLYRVGTLKISGNRLWLRDKHGFRYFYCHLSDFAASAYNGADVHAGEVIGFVGNTGDAEPTPPHLHFEVHMPDDKVVDPSQYLHKWDTTGVSSASWIRRYGKDPGLRPGALVVVKDFLAQP